MGARAWMEVSTCIEEERRTGKESDQLENGELDETTIQPEEGCASQQWRRQGTRGQIHRGRRPPRRPENEQRESEKDQRHRNLLELTKTKEFVWTLASQISGEAGTESSISSSWKGMREREEKGDASTSSSLTSTSPTSLIFPFPLSCLGVWMGKRPDNQEVESVLHRPSSAPS